jgi:hypothetical protein
VEAISVSECPETLLERHQSSKRMLRTRILESVVKALTVQIGKQLGVRQLDDWYGIKQDDIIKHGGI